MLFDDYDNTIYNVQAMFEKFVELTREGLSNGNTVADATFDAHMVIEVKKDNFRL